MHSTARRTIATVGAFATLVALAGCSSDGGGGGDTAAPATDMEIGAIDLSEACPATVTIQTDWNPESEHGMLYQLLGEDYTVDADLKTVSGPLMASGEYTGVDVEVRSGGPAIGFQTVLAQMYQDTDITLGYAATDEQVQLSAQLPVTSVLAPLDINPQMIMWDPETYPEVETIADLGDTGAIVRYFGGAAYMEYLIADGQLSLDQVDGGYDGSPAGFVSAQGADAQQGFASAEPYVYENEVADWGKPVAFELIHDAGWQSYAATMGVRSAELEELSPCLELLVPVMQQATVDFYADPAMATDLILELVDAFDTGWVYSQGVADFSVAQQVELGLVSNGDNETIGDFDTDRVQEILDVMGPIATDLGTPPADGLTVDDLVTNEFIDDSIGLP
ncbi:substrate-binding domain-containing protein [Marisediminicola senii]|uniref:ABC transporter substrate-binding protein n=1 Tax=Marisediminicola senii TaxID=2711233 RepID=UPI0013ECF9ED|nr:ABC transporter substrate-binding protein [Marisediminicola senii]